MAPPPTSMFWHQKWMHSLKCQQFFSGAGLFLNFMQHFLDVTQIYDLQIFGLKNLFQIGDSPFWCVAQLSSIGFICSELLGWDSCLWCKDLCKALRCREIKREKLFAHQKSPCKEHITSVSDTSMHHTTFVAKHSCHIFNTNLQSHTSHIYVWQKDYGHTKGVQVISIQVLAVEFLPCYRGSILLW